MTVAAAIQQLDDPPELVFAGFRTVDGETGHAGPQTQWCLDVLLVTHVISMAVDYDEEML